MQPWRAPRRWAERKLPGAAPLCAASADREFEFQHILAAQYFDLHFVARLFLLEHRRQIGDRFDLLAVELLEEIAVFDAGFGGRRILDDFDKLALLAIALDRE